MNGKWRAIGIASLSLLVGAFLTIVGYSVRGLLWDRPAVEVKRVEADAATVTASAEKEKAAAEIAKAKAESVKAIAEREQAYAALQQAYAMLKAAAAADKQADAEKEKARAQSAEVDFLASVVNPHLNDPMKRIGDFEDRIVLLEAKLEEPGLSTEQRVRIFEEKRGLEKEIALIERATRRKMERTVDAGMAVVGYTVSALKQQASALAPSLRTAALPAKGEMQ
jgi:hypothetical protein